MSQPAYRPPVVYQQGTYSATINSNTSSSGPPSTYPNLSSSDSGSFAGWMGRPPQSQQQQQQQYPQQVPHQQPSGIFTNYPSPYQQQQAVHAQQQPYPQQLPTQQPYPCSQPQLQPYAYNQQLDRQQQQPRYGQNSMNQRFSIPSSSFTTQAHQPYLAPTTYNPAPPGTPGRKKALLIGCCYPGTSQALNGCINDVQCIEYCLKNRFGFNQPGSIVVLRDDQHHPDYVSTRANIVRGIQWLMQEQRPGDSLFFHFSGHGSQQIDYSGDELDGQDETILPTDYKSAGMIVDDELNALMVQPLQYGVMLHALIDACHSGTAMDLPYRAKYSDGRFSWKLKSRVIKATSGGTAFQFGACKDSQVAADTNAMSGSAYTGAATFSFIDAVERYGTQQTYASLLQHMMETLRQQQGPGGTSSALSGLSGGLTGVAVGLMASFLLGAGALGGQVPVICCDKQVDLYNMTLAI